MSFPFPRPFPGPVFFGSLLAVENLLANELNGFTIDFVANTFQVKITTDAEKLLLLLGDEWNGLAMDFTTNLYATVTSSNAEELLGNGPNSAEPMAMTMDFTDNSYVVSA